MKKVKRFVKGIDDNLIKILLNEQYATYAWRFELSFFLFFFFLFFCIKPREKWSNTWRQRLHYWNIINTNKLPRIKTVTRRQESRDVACKLSLIPLFSSVSIFRILIHRNAIFHRSFLINLSAPILKLHWLSNRGV